MGLATFRQGGSTTGSSPYPKLNTYTNPYPTNYWGGSTSFVSQTNYLYYAYRSGAANRGLRVVSSTEVQLISVTSTGIDTVVATIDPTTYLPNAQLIPPEVICYSTTDQCWYIILSYVNPTYIRLIKVDDTTGTVTTLGAAFNPTNPLVSWPSLTNGHTISSFYLDNATGHLKLVCNGFYHLMNKTTGAIVSQDTPLTLVSGGYSLLGCGYITQDGTVGHGGVSTSTAVTYTRMFGTSGHLGSLSIPDAHLNFPVKFLQKLNYIDHDKIYVGAVASGSCIKVTTVAEYDKFIKAVYDYNK